MNTAERTAKTIFTVRGPLHDVSKRDVLTRSNVVPTGADAKRMLFYRFLYDTGRISDDDN